MYGIWTRFFNSGKIRCGSIIKDPKLPLDADGEPTTEREYPTFTERLFTYKDEQKAKQHILDCTAFSTR